VRLAACLLLLGGCNLVFPRDVETVGPDAPIDDCPIAPTPLCGVDDPDEDGDGVRDDCDPCPASTNQTGDADGDNIGDACDPHAGAPRCAARRFDGFSTDDGRWIDSSGFAFDGAARLQLPTDTQHILKSKELHGPGRAEVVIADRIFDSAIALAGVVMMATETTGYFCALHPQGATGTLMTGILIRHEFIKGESQTRFSQTPGVFHRLRLTVTAGGQVTCLSERSNDGQNFGTLDAMLEFTDDKPPVPGSYGLILQGSTDEVEYVDFIPD
jgi:hypothetical protein